jgi:hypothetical protein
VFAQNLQRSIRTRVIIGDDRIDLLADVVQRVLENKRFIANTGDSDQKVLPTQQACIAGRDLFTVAKLPIVHARHDYYLGAIGIGIMMVAGRSNGKGFRGSLHKSA